MARKPDAMAVFESTLEGLPTPSPWTHAHGETPAYSPDYNILAALLSVPVQAEAGSESGLFPKGIDLWLSHELRRAGFGEEETWPRPTRPRVFPREIALLLEALPSTLRGFRGLDLHEEIRRRITDSPAVSPTEAVVLGRAYDKQVDVCIARWDRGPEVLISTKAQLSSFGKNLPNRFEEAYGDAANLRARYPLAAVGFFFVQRATILQDEPEAFERAKDMIRKLRSETDGPGYTATGLCLVNWHDSLPANERTVEVILDDVPDDIRPNQFMTGIVEQVLRVTPVTHHVLVRERYERRAIPVDKTDQGAGVRSNQGEK